MTSSGREPKSSFTVTWRMRGEGAAGPVSLPPAPNFLPLALLLSACGTVSIMDMTVLIGPRVTCWRNWAVTEEPPDHTYLDPGPSVTNLPPTGTVTSVTHTHIIVSQWAVQQNKSLLYPADKYFIVFRDEQLLGGSTEPLNQNPDEENSLRLTTLRILFGFIDRKEIIRTIQTLVVLLLLAILLSNQKHQNQL